MSTDMLTRWCVTTGTHGFRSESIASQLGLVMSAGQNTASAHKLGTGTDCFGDRDPHRSLPPGA